MLCCAALRSGRHGWANDWCNEVRFLTGCAVLLHLDILSSVMAVVVLVRAALLPCRAPLTAATPPPPPAPPLATLLQQGAHER